ncbi:NADPH--cytochrome p450 reductase, putative [Trypanosoma brucei gambiense DAL972]|uniref:NADPH--cytochrome p450 reductase, putative n=1 Tax=Trypanosoma brucei gambiense (strain MHOM/CI/86/DAL972) TaxID=679716 RepID=C9ZM57_TRYB9|nr:NADPH--cytochrome p450 reductase, putative [Trypanosoma brucei gambiense DAL972]CBH10482.1 NADPH--cytochrome p450 reductase, putative [Trypanosoma brucei gambiense DAL972]|eukprot:XP_011772772.1 NADPH--cytochrome p450 reductase, putative [Trypanosoma brucei gambiense DAL972]
MEENEGIGTITILYGTQTGSAEQLAFTFASLAIKRGFKRCVCLPADEFPLDKWRDATPLVIICSNANQGEAPDSIRISWAQLLHSTAPSMDGLRFAVFGTGDSIYPKFNYMAKMLHNRLRQLGGTPLLNRGLGDESDRKGYDEVFLPWVLELWRALGLVSEDDSHLKEENPSDAPLLCKYEVVPCNDESAPQGGVDVAVRRREPVFNCRLVQNKRLTAEDHLQAVHHIAFSRETTPAEGSLLPYDTPLAFEVGDALGVYCTNEDAIIDRVLTQVNEDGDKVVCIKPNNSQGIIQQQEQPFFNRPMTLRFFLKHYVDLEAVVSRSFFRMMAHYAEDAELKERLWELSSSDNLDDFMWYCQREKRNVAEVLDDFRAVRPPLPLLLSFMPPMRARLFSISSSPYVDCDTFHLTVALVEWQTPYKRTRRGLCSSRLTSAKPSDVFTCFLWDGTMITPSTPAPLLCVGTGTGVAPIRSLIRECAGHSDIWGEVPILLFFGCRNETKDYLYQQEWADLKRDHLKQLQVLPAFSRDGEKKFYVQHQIGRHARRVAKLLDAGAIIYVCGNSKQMPKDVATTFEDVVTQCCCEGDEAKSQEYMKQLRKQGRYVVDTWSV